jgi:hypothetical protein
MTLDKELKDEDGKHISGRKIHSRRFKYTKGAVNKAMLFVYTPFELQSFKGNSLERNIYISFNFKPVIQKIKKVTLFSNGCESHAAIEQLHPPSIEINFFPHNETMQFIFRTESKSLDIYRKPRRVSYATECRLSNCLYEDSNVRYFDILNAKKSVIALSLFHEYDIIPMYF